MGGEEIILRDEDYKFRMLNSVPKPEADEAYILYRNDKREENVLVITPQKPALSTQIRFGRYNRKMTISMVQREYILEKEILDETGFYKFLVEIKVSYQPDDVESIFLYGSWNFAAIIEDSIFDKIEAKNRRYNIEDQIDLEDNLRIEVLKSIGLFNYWRVTSFEVNVRLDNRAQKVIDSKLDLMADSVLISDSAEREQIEIEKKKQIQLEKLKADKEIEDKANELIMIKAKGIKQMREEFSDDYATILANIKGEISTVEMEKRLRDNLYGDMANRTKILQQLAGMQISDSIIEEAAKNLLGIDELGNIHEEPPALLSSDDILFEEREEL